MASVRPRRTAGGHGPSNIVLGRMLDRQALERSFAAKENGTPPQWVLDKIADQSITGGYKIGKKRANVCTGCYSTRSVNGKCLCE